MSFIYFPPGPIPIYSTYPNLEILQNLQNPMSSFIQNMPQPYT
jgi:hypothetical protein